MNEMEKDQLVIKLESLIFEIERREDLTDNYKEKLINDIKSLIDYLWPA